MGAEDLMQEPVAAEKRSFIIYRTATNWPRIVIVTDEEPVIAALSERASHGKDDGFGNAVVEMPHDEYTKADHDKMLAHLESKVGPRTPPIRIVAVDFEGTVVNVVEHPEPDRFIANRLDDSVTYEVHAEAKMGATKLADGSFENLVELMVDDLEPRKGADAVAGGRGGSASVELSNGDVIVAAPGEIVTVSLKGEVISRVQGPTKDGGSIRIEK